jgi:hypothetical protein
MLMATTAMAASSVTLQYTEPSTNQAGNPLTNLKETTIYLKQDGGVEQIIKVPASGPAGGGAIVKTTPINDPPLCGSTTVVAQVTASNTLVTNFESPRSAQATGTKAANTAGCALPNAPFNLTITIQ